MAENDRNAKSVQSCMDFAFCAFPKIIIAKYNYHMHKLKEVLFLKHVDSSLLFFTCVDAISPSQQFFSHVETFPGLDQTIKADDKVSSSRTQ